ncbi:DUF1826 domain-containing protein, partial [Arthrospira platensis SPKY1]|nr:DUF1826 domain-containing protein [Arthrospira platensis SPKY1]
MLTSIFDPDCQIVCWQRGVLDSVASDIERALALGELRTGFRTVIAPGDLQSGLPLSIESCPALRADIAFLVELYADLIGCQKVGVRLEYLNSAMCPR